MGFMNPHTLCLSNAPTITPNNGKAKPVKKNAITAAKRNDHYLGLNLGGKIRLLRQKHSE